MTLTYSHSDDIEPIYSPTCVATAIDTSPLKRHKSNESDSTNYSTELYDKLKHSMRVTSHNSNTTVISNNNTSNILYRLPNELFETCMLYLSGCELLLTLNLTCHKLHDMIMTNDTYWHKALQQLITQYQYYCGPNINDIQALQYTTYVSLYRSLAPYIGLFGHFSCSNTVLGQYVCGRYNSHTRCIELVHIDIDNIQYNNNILTIQLDPTQATQPYTYAMNDVETSHHSHPEALQQHLATVQFSTQNTTDTNKSHKVEYVTDYKGNTVNMNQLLLYSGSVTSRLDNRLYQYLHNLTPTLLRRHSQLYYPNPAITLHRIPLKQSVQHTWSHIDREQTLLSQQWYSKGFLSAGLYMGSYGAHGNELVYCRYENEYEFVAYKILGDANVPAGKVTFRIDCRTDVEREDSYAQQTSQRQPPDVNSTLPLQTIQQALLLSRYHVYENHNILPDVNTEYNSMIVRAAAGHELDADIRIDDMTTNIDAAELTAEVVEDLHVVNQLMHARRLVPVHRPAVRVIHTRPGQGSIALSGYQRARIIPLQAHIHTDNTFTLDFLGLVRFSPYQCICMNHSELHERYTSPISTSTATMSRT